MRISFPQPSRRLPPNKPERMTTEKGEHRSPFFFLRRVPQASCEKADAVFRIERCDIKKRASGALGSAEHPMLWNCLCRPAKRIRFAGKML
jgi:hypothetical protein